jgi:alpha-glucosidase
MPDHAAAPAEAVAFSAATAAGTIEVTIRAPRVIRVRVAADGQPDGLSYIAPDFAARAAESCIITPETPAVLGDGDLVVRVQPEPLSLLFGNSTELLLRAPIAAGVSQELVDRRAATPLLPDESAPAPARRTRMRACFEWIGEQHFYGLGEGGKQFDRLDGARQLWNSHFVHGPGSDIGVPLLLSSRGYALFFDNTSDARLSVGRTEDTNQIVYEVENGPLNWYYIAGGDMRTVLGELSALLGPAIMPPRWSLGFLQSTRHFTSIAELESLPRTLREKRIPCDGIVFLSTYGDALGWNRGVGHLQFEPALFPNPAETVAALADQGFQTITHEYPVLHEDSPLVAAAAERGFVLDAGYERRTPTERPSVNFQEGQRFLDFSNAEVRAWWWAQHHDLMAMGVEGWWLDGGEGPPASATLHAGSGSALHNIYDRLRHQAFAEGEARDRPDRRPFLLCRSGAAGMQRFGASCWSGDINNTFATLEAQIPLGLNTGLSGIPYWGTDIGGFFHPLPESGELYARWFQFGAFCPGFRSHGYVWREHLPWAHGPAIEAICRTYAELRYRLLPYTYTLAWQVYTLGLPLMRPLVLNYPHDPRVWELGGEYLWGDDLLVAPVTREGATAWPAYLPGGVWYDFWTQQRYEGPAGVTVEAPLDRLPLFARGGAILPLAPPAQFDGEHSWDEITLLIYPERDSRFDLYEDDGRTNTYREGGYAITPIECAAGSAQITVRVGEASGDHNLIPPDRTYTVQVRSGPPRRVALAGAGTLPERRDGTQPGPCYWHDGRHFTYIRTGAKLPTVIIDL